MIVPLPTTEIAGLFTFFINALARQSAQISKSLLLALPFMCASADARTISGLVYPLHDVTLSAGIPGIVMRRLVEPGQRVKAAQVLVMLDDRLQIIESNRRKVILEDKSELMSIRDRTAIMSTLLEDARLIYKKTGSISKDELFRLDAEYISSKGRLDQLVEQKKRERLEYEGAERERLQRYIVAPVAGTVTKVLPQVGEWAKLGDPVVLLVDSSISVLHVAIPYKEIGNLKVGDAQIITLQAGGAVPTVAGKITFISPVADPASGLVEVRITFSNTQLAIKPGIKGSIQISTTMPTPLPSSHNR